MRKLTLFFTTLFLSVGMAWAQTATLEVSTNVGYPEYQYELKNANGIWMASNTAPTEDNIASFAFFGTDNADFYKIYSIDKGQWVSYDKSNGSDNCKDFVKFAESQDAANAWKITQATRGGNAVYQIQPQNNDGSVSNRYMNWNAGVGNGGGYGYTYDDTKTVGLWRDNGSADGGSAWILSEVPLVSISEIANFNNGDIYTFVTARGWMGAADDKDKVISTAYVSADAKRNDANFQWTVYMSKNGKYYLYNIGKGQFMGVESNNNTAVSFAATPQGTKLTFKKSSDTNYPIMFSTDNNAVVNHSGNHQYGLISWTGGWNTLNDGGSNHKVEKVGILDETTLAKIEDLVAQYEETAILKMPEAGKYYRIMAVEGWNDDARYLGSKNYQGMTRAEYVANADAYSIFYFDGNYLKSYASGHYLVSNGGFLGYNGVQATGSKIGFQEDTYVAGVYNISFNDGGRWLYVHQNNYTDAGSRAENKNGYRFNIEEVTQLPVAQGGNTVYYTLADAKANVKAGETLTLFVDTDETIELPLGVILEKNGHTADNVTVATPVAKVGEAEYASLAAAIKAAPAGSTITFVADINGNVTLSKNVTIDGADFNYTGTMSANNALTVTVQNVHFVNGGFSKNNDGTSGTYTIKDCTFDGQGKYAYPVLAKNIGTLNVENCTVKDYQFGFLYVKKQSTKVSVKSVSVENCANYAVYLASGVTTATIENLNVKNSNNGILWPSAGARTLKLSGCKFENVKTAINSNGGAYVVTANVQGVNNDFGTAVLSDNVKCVLAEDATLAATTANLNITTNVDGKEVVYQGGKYSVAVKRAPAGQVAYRADVTDKTDREGIAILLKDPYAKNSLVVKVYNGETLMFTCTRRDIDDEGKVMFPVTANTTANIVLSGKESGSWINEIHVAPTELNIPNRVEIWADGVLVQNYTHESGTILGTNLEKYLALDCVKKFDAKIGNAGYETLAAAVEAANAGETIGLLRDVTASGIITINKAITLDGNGNTLTSTAARAFNIETEGKVVISNLTVNAGERAFNIINKPATVELNGVTATANNNAVMIATSAGAANVTINGCDFTGLAVVNVAGVKSNVAIKNSTITNVDANPAENYGAITVWSSAEEAVVNVENTTIIVADDSKKAYVFPANATVNGVDEDEIGRIIVTVGDAGYETLAEAVEKANGETIKFAMDAEGPGVVINKNTVIDFNGKTYTFTEGVGSTGTPSNGFQILKGNNVTLKNGTLNVAAEAADKFYILVQNYANLTVENMTLDGKYLDKWVATDGDSYVLSNNSGTVNVIGSTIKANDEGSLAFAMDACLKAPYEAPVVTVADGSTVNGNVEVSATLNMNGTLNGNIVINAATGTVNGAAEGLNVITNVADHKVVNNNGAYTIVKKQYVAQVGEQKYETFAAAVAAAPAGGTVTLVADAVEAKTVVLTKNLTIDGADKTFTGAIEFKKSNGFFTIKNVKFNGAGDRVYALKSQSNTTDLTVENCEATGYTYGFLYANSAIANVTVTDVTVKDVTYGVHSARGTNVTLNNFVAENVEYGVMLQNYSGRNVVLNNCSFTGCENPLYVWKRDGYENKITFNFQGANEMGKADFCTSDYAVVKADAVVGTKVCGTLAAAVEAAQAGETVTLLRNAQLSTFVTINKSITLNMGEYNITRDGGTALYVNGDNAVVVINGTGTVTGSQALWVANGLAKVNGGNFCGVAEAVYVTNTGKAEIYGGTFSSSNFDSFVLNKKDADREATDITVYGGTFVGFNPANNAAEGQGTNFVATGLMAVDNGDGTFGIAKANIKMGDSYYATLAEAIAAAQGGETITLLGNIEEDVTVSKNLTIEGTAGMQYTGTMTLNKVNVTIQNLNFVKGQISKSKNNNGGNVTIVNCNFDGQGMNTYAVNVARTGSVVIENVTAQNYGYGFLQLSHANNKLSIKDVKVMNTNYALKIDYSNSVTIDGLKVENVAIAAIYNSNYGAKTYTITNSDFSGATEAIKMWERNTTVYDTFVFAGGNTLGNATLSTSPYAIYKGVVADVAGKKFLDLRAAFDAAQDGETVTLLEDVTLDAKTFALNDDNYPVIINVEDKAVTFDLNGNIVTVDAAAADLAGKMLLGVFSADLGGHLTLTDNTDAKAGSVIVNVNDATVYSVFASESNKYSDKSRSGKITVNGGNYTTVGKLANAMFFCDTDEAITINGGNFHCDGATTTSAYPWMVNTLGNNELNVVINGGTFNVDVNHQHRPFEVKIAETSAVNPNGDGTWTVVPAVAYITEMIGSTVNEPGDNARKVGYATLAAAVEAAEADEVVTLLAHVTGAGLVINKDVTIDFNEKTYTFNEGVGSNGTESNGFQILKGNNVTLQNGTLDVAAEAADKFYILVQNYANLTVEDMTLDGTNLDKWSATDGDSYVLSNNSGEVLITGNTDIIANNEGDKAFAFDACDKTAAGYELPKVYVQKTADDDVITITGKIERTGKAAIAISSGIFTTPIADEWCAEYYVPVQNADGTYGVEKRYIDEKTIVDGSYTEFVNEKKMTVGTLTYERDFTGFEGWQSLFVPFEIPVEQLTTLGYEVAYFFDVHYSETEGGMITENIKSVHFVKITQGRLRANYPYVIKRTSEADPLLSVTLEDATLYSTDIDELNTVESSSTTTRFVFAGTYKKMGRVALTGDDNTPCYRFTPQGQVQKMSATANLVPFRVCMYIKTKDNAPVILDTTNAPEYVQMRVIGESDDETTDIKFYDLDEEQNVDYIYDLQGRRVLEPQKGGLYIVNGKKIVF